MGQRKLYHVVRIELGVIEANSEEEAFETCMNEGFNIGHSTEAVFEDGSEDHLFWANLDVDQVKEMRNQILKLNSP